MDLFNTIENKARFYGMKIDLMWKKHKTILRMCLRGLAFLYIFAIRLIVCSLIIDCFQWNIKSVV